MRYQWHLLTLISFYFVYVRAKFAFSDAKMNISNPIITVIIEEKPVRLVLTTDIDGILICTDLTKGSYIDENMDFTYARKFLRFQLQAINFQYTSIPVTVPDLDLHAKVPVAYFKNKKQWHSPLSVEYFLKGNNATGFLGVGFGKDSSNSAFWELIYSKFHAYRYNYRGMMYDTKEAVMKLQNNSDKVVWSEPFVPIDRLSTEQGLSFVLHHFTLCEKSVLGEFSSNWEATFDYNTPCLGLPEEFYEALQGWIGMEYNQESKVSQIIFHPDTLEPNASVILPELSFYMSHHGGHFHLPLEAFVLKKEEQEDGFYAITLCIQRTSTIIQNGGSFFSPLDENADSVQRYRLHGSLGLPMYNTLYSPIIFGTMAMNLFDSLIFDGTLKRTGLQQRVDSLPPHNDTLCAKPVTCTGQQTYMGRINGCKDPDCDLYYFHHLDVETQTCRMNDDFQVVVFTLLAILVGGELLFVTFVQKKLHTIHQDTIPLNGS